MIAAFWILLSVLAAVIAARKERGWFLILVASLIFSPIVGLFLALAIRSQAQLARRDRSYTLRVCPYCSEVVRRSAWKCSHCGESLPEAAPPISFSRDAWRTLNSRV